MGLQQLIDNTMDTLFENHMSMGRGIAIVQANKTLDDIHMTGNNVFVVWRHGSEMVMTAIPDNFGDRQVLDAWTDKHRCELVEGADDILDGVAWQFVCESGIEWLCRIVVEPLRTRRDDMDPAAFMIAGHVLRNDKGKWQPFGGLVDVEID